MNKERDSWYFKNKEYAQSYQREYRKNNPGKCSARSAKRRTSLKNAIPKDITNEQLSEMDNIYTYAYMLTQFSGVEHHVDHILPIKKGGLHVPSNLRITTASYNEAKKDHICDFDMDIDCKFYKELNENKLVRTQISSKSRRRSVICLETGQEFYSLSQCAKHFNIPVTAISRVVNKKRKSVNGLHFYFKSEAKDLDKLKEFWQFGKRLK